MSSLIPTDSKIKLPDLTTSDLSRILRALHREIVFRVDKERSACASLYNTLVAISYTQVAAQKTGDLQEAA